MDDIILYIYMKVFNFLGVIIDINYNFNCFVEYLNELNLVFNVMKIKWMLVFIF